MATNCTCGSIHCVLCYPVKYVPSDNWQPSDTWKIPISTMPQKGWECPKCTRVYGPAVTECWACNVLVGNGLAGK